MLAPRSSPRTHTDWAEYASSSPVVRTLSTFCTVDVVVPGINWL